MLLAYGAITLDSPEIFLFSGKQTKHKNKRRGAAYNNHEARLGVCGQRGRCGVCVCVFVWVRV